MTPTGQPSVAQLKVTSSAFANGQLIPRRHTGDGEDLSPPLSWTGVPGQARSLALICDDPDAPSREPWVHWVIYNIPVSMTGLPQGVPRQPQPAAVPGASQGRNSWPSNHVGYRGPAPPPGKPHHYHFQLYALDQTLGLAAGADKAALLKAMAGHVVGRGELMGVYQR